MIKEYNYKIQTWAILFYGSVFLLFIGGFLGLAYINWSGSITMFDLSPQNTNLLSIILAFLLTLCLFVFIRRNSNIRKLNHRFIVTDKEIIFPPKPYLKDTLKIQFNQIKSVEKVSSRGFFAISLNTELGDFSIPEMFLETKEMLLEIYDLIHGNL
ncbi:MAG: hypothetical protein GY760_04355 [Deltaproteobacteria bacterium]|nr:hypothetical protein [Deltaproteobacteria bacterium]